jgi:hypothetical protein
MMMLSSNIAAVMVVMSPVLLIVGLEHRTISLIVSSIFVVALVPSFACDQVVPLWIILSLVA